MATVQFQNEEYEKCIISILLLDNNLIDLVAGRITKDCFYNPKLRYIYEKMCNQWKKDHCTNILTLTDNDTQISPVYLTDVSSTLASTANWEFYVLKLNELYTARKLRSELGEKLNKVTPENIEKNIEEIQASISSYTVKQSDGYTMKDLAISNAEQVQNAKKAGKLITGFETGFEKLDEIIDGFQPGNMYVIGARPSIGKTAFALAVATGIASKGVKTTIFSLEMSADSLYYRMVAAESRLPMWQIKKGHVVETQQMMQKYIRANQKLYELPITILDSDVDNDKALYARIRYEARVKGVKNFVIDHLGLIEVTDSSGQRYVDVGRITKTIHKMARELNVCIILLAQCGREAEGKKPNLALLRESGNIEQDADVIMLLHRQRDLSGDNDDPMKQVPTDVIVAKNRDGRTGTAMFSFQPICMKFAEDSSGRSELNEAGDQFEMQRRKE